MNGRHLTVNVQFTLPAEFLANGDEQAIAAACDNISAILSEQGTHANPPLLLDWCNRKEGDTYSQPKRVGNQFVTTIHLLCRLPEHQPRLLLSHLRKCKCRYLVQDDTEVVIPDDYTEGQFWN